MVIPLDLWQIACLLVVINNANEPKYDNVLAIQKINISTITLQILSLTLLPCCHKESEAIVYKSARTCERYEH